jgi:hypothetical protein
MLDGEILEVTRVDGDRVICIVNMERTMRRRIEWRGETEDISKLTEVQRRRSLKRMRL